MLYTEISGRFWLVLRQSVTSRSTLLRFGNFAEIQLGPRPNSRRFPEGEIGRKLGPHFPAPVTIERGKWNWTPFPRIFGSHFPGPAFLSDCPRCGYI